MISRFNSLLIFLISALILNLNGRVVRVASNQNTLFKEFDYKCDGTDDQIGLLVY